MSESEVVLWLTGIAATIVAAFVMGIPRWINIQLDGRKVYSWMQKNTNSGERFRSTRAIASHNNMTEERVRIICSNHPKIKLSTGTKPDMWTLGDPQVKGFFDGDEEEDLKNG